MSSKLIPCRSLLVRSFVPQCSDALGLCLLVIDTLGGHVLCYWHVALLIELQFRPRKRQVVVHNYIPLNQSVRLLRDFQSRLILLLHLLIELVFQRIVPLFGLILFALL